jgi:hypothetical protein
MIGNWFTAAIRFTMSYRPELIWADAPGPFADWQEVESLVYDSTIPDDEEIRLQAMLMCTMFT